MPNEEDIIMNQAVLPFVIENREKNEESSHWLSLAEATGVADPSFERKIELSDMRAEIEKRITSLPRPLTDIENAILDLRFNDGMTREEVAHQLNLTPDQVRGKEIAVLDRLRRSVVLKKVDD